ncbi:MAG: PHP domain-containing protein, partial [Melioribacteraceae bacterium]|nr:PHP domain-containing protein [Melioribacteraceae bacterium]
LEISTDIEGQEVHLLGYYVNYKDPELRKYLTFFRKERLERAKRILRKLENIGISLNLSDVQELAQNSPICRPHIAKAMVKAGIVKDFYSAFNKYIGDTGPAAEKKIHVSPQSAIKIINDAGGLAFIAHPGKMKESILTSLINLGIDGIEVIHSSHRKNQQKFYRGIVNQYCLLESGGSDFHGGPRNDIENFGKFFTSEMVLDNLKKMVQTRLVS